MRPHPEVGPDEERLCSAAESILLVAAEPVGVKALAAALEVPVARVGDVLENLRTQLQGGIRLQLHDGQAQLVTAPENAEIVQRFLGSVRLPALSRAALEVLSVVAYRQPVTRAEIEAARAVNSDRVVQTLLARGLLEECGRRDTIGRPAEYGTTFDFLEYFGLSSLQELPSLPTPAPVHQPDLGLHHGSQPETTA